MSKLRPNFHFFKGQGFIINIKSLCWFLFVFVVVVFVSWWPNEMSDYIHTQCNLKKNSQVVVAHAFNPGTWKADIG